MVLSTVQTPKRTKQQKHYVIRVFSGSWKKGAKEELQQELEMMNPFDYDIHKQQIEEKFQTQILPELDDLKPSSKGEGLEFGANKIPEPYEREAIREFFRKQFSTNVSISINQKLD